MTGRLTANGALAILIVLSLAALAAFEFGAASLVTGIGLFLIALVKVNLIITHFMHLRWRHLPFRQVLLGWSLLVLLVLCGGLLLMPWEATSV